MLNSKFDSMQSIESGNKGEIVMYQPDETIRLEVRVENETVWLNRQQMASLFGRDVKTIGKHINMLSRKNWLTYQLSQILRQFRLKVADLSIEPLNTIVWT